MTPSKTVIPNSSGNSPNITAASDGARQTAVWLVGQRNPLPTGPLRNPCRRVAIPGDIRARPKIFADSVIAAPTSLTMGNG